MSLEFNAENRNTMPSRCCSFCRRAGHNITRCNSEPIRIFERQTRNYINFIMPLRLEGRSYLENLNYHLLNEALNDSNLVRAFAISRCGANTRTNMASCIQLIIQHFMPLIQNIETMNQISEDVRDFVQSQPVESQPAEEDQPAEGDQPVARIVRRFGFLGSTYETGFQGLLGRNNESLLYAMMFIEMIRSINESNSINRKFQIKTKIVENQDGLEEKCECNICYDEHEKKNFIKLDCGHEFCKDCIKQSLQNERRETPCCAFCRSDIKNFELKLESIKDELDELITSEF